MVLKSASAALAGILLFFGVSGCSRSPQARAARFLEQGKKRFQQRDYARAILQFKNAAQALPNDAEPYYQLGLVHLATNDIRSAASAFYKATELNPKHAGAQLRLAELMSLSRDLETVEKAGARARDVLASEPGDLDALNLLAFTELRLGKPDSAEAHLEEALRRSPNHLKSSVALAKTRLARRDAKGAEEALREAVARAPHSPEAVVSLGEFYLATGKTAESEQQFRRALQIDPKHGPALLNLGALQARAGQHQQAEQTYRQLSSLPEKRYKPVHALFLFQSGQRNQAVVEFEKLAREDPADRDARSRLVAAYLAVGRVPEATKVLTAALEKNPNDADALLQRSRIYLGSAKHADAQADLSRALRVRTDSAEAHYLLSKLHQARGEATSRQHELGEALRLDPGYLAARIELAQILIAARGARTALNLLDGAPQEQKGTLPVILQRNWALLSLGDKAEARRGIDQALALSRVPDALLQDAVLKINQNDHPGARASAEEVLKRNPEDIRALRVLADSFAAQNQTPAALRRIREHAALHANSASVQQFLGQLLLKHGDRAEARKAFEAAKSLNPGWPVPDLSLAELDIAENKLDTARTVLSAVLSANPGTVAARLMLALVEERDRNPSAAIEHYRKAIEADPGNVVALNNLAYRLAEANQPDEALKYAQQAKELAPESPAVDNTLGWVYFRKGIYASAVKHLESAAAKESTPLRNYHLGMAYMKAGDHKRGQQVLEAALRMDPRLPEAETARQFLKSTAK